MGFPTRAERQDGEAFAYDECGTDILETSGAPLRDGNALHWSISANTSWTEIKRVREALQQLADSAWCGSVSFQAASAEPQHFVATAHGERLQKRLLGLVAWLIRDLDTLPELEAAHAVDQLPFAKPSLWRRWTSSTDQRRADHLGSLLCYASEWIAPTNEERLRVWEAPLQPMLSHIASEAPLGLRLFAAQLSAMRGSKALVATLAGSDARLQSVIADLLRRMSEGGRDSAADISHAYFIADAMHKHTLAELSEEDGLSEATEAFERWRARHL